MLPTCCPFLTSTSTFQLIWVCILCRKKQELLIKTGTWMQSTSDFSTDPILRRIEQDMAPSAAGSSVASTPQHMPSVISSPVAGGPVRKGGVGSSSSSTQAPGPTTTAAAGGNLGSLFNRAMSFAGGSGGQRLTANLLSPMGSYGTPASTPGRSRVTLRQQRSLESSDSMQSPCGGLGSIAGAGSSPFTRRYDLGSSSEMILGSRGPQGPKSSPQQGPATTKYRLPFSRPSRGRPLLSRGRSMDQPGTSSSYMGYPTHGGRGGRPNQQSVASTPMSSHSLNVGSDMAPAHSTHDYMSAPEDTGAWSEPNPQASRLIGTGYNDMKHTTATDRHPYRHRKSSIFGKSSEKRELF